jgi:hypothetical protein
MAKRTPLREWAGMGGKKRFTGLLDGIYRVLAGLNKIGARWRRIQISIFSESYMAFFSIFYHIV